MHPNALLLPSSLLLFIQIHCANAAGWQDYDSVPRWGQSSSVASNRWLVYGGKTDASGGQSRDSAPNSNDLLSLDLTDSNPTWQRWSDEPDSAPSAAYHTLSILSSNASSYSALLYGGDVSDTALPTATDSSYLLDLPAGFHSASASSDLELTWSHPANDWADQPMRRIKAATATVAGPNTVFHYVFGGLRNDGSAGFDELWCFQAGAASLSDPSWTRASTSGTSPPVSYGHTMTLLSNEDQYRLLVMGGQSSNNALNSLSTVYIFTPSETDRCSGQWSSFEPSGTAPTNRQGHAAVALSSNEVLIHGGADAGESSVYSDMARLTFEDSFASAEWSPVSPSGGSGPGARYMHSAARSGDQVLFAFGYGESNPAEDQGGFAVFNVEDEAWTDDYEAAEESGSKNSPNGVTGSDSSSNTDSNRGATGSGDAVGDADGSGSSGSHDDENNNSGSDSSNGDSSESDQDDDKQDAAPSDNNGSGDSDGENDQGGPFHTPGVGDTPSGSDDSDSSKTDDSGSASSKSNTGVIVGSVASVIVVAFVAGGGYWFYHRQKQQSSAYYSHGGGGRKGEGAEHLFSSDGDDAYLEKATPVGASVLPSDSSHSNGLRGAAKSALAGMLGVGRRAPSRAGGGRRFDMLADEESMYSGRCNSRSSSGTLRNWAIGRRQTSSGWQEAPLADPTPEEERQLAPPPMPSTAAEIAIRESNRSNVKIWDGVYGSTNKNVQRSRSFMSHALGPWLGRTPDPDGVSEYEHDTLPTTRYSEDRPQYQHRTSNPGDRPMGPRYPSRYSNPFSSLDDEAYPYDDISTADHTAADDTYLAPSSSGHGPLSTAQSSDLGSAVGKLPSKRKSEDGGSIAFSPSASLNGSTFSPLSSSQTQAYKPLRRNASWWARFSSGVTSPSSTIPIRDTSPLPLAAITESDPYASLQERNESDCASPQTEDYDEQGRRPEGYDSRAVRQTGSQTSEASGQTAKLEQYASMQIVQRRVSGSQASSVASPALTEGTDLGEQGMATEALEIGSPIGQSQMPRVASLKRPHRERRSTAGATGVRNMIAAYESRSSPPIPQREDAPSPSKKSPRKRGTKIEHEFAPKEQLVLANPD